MNRLISIIMTSYNYANYIGGAIESIIAQTYNNWELIIIDDCSTDNSIEIIQKYAKLDERIKFFINEKNLGLSKSIQRGLEESHGEWVAFLESDDMFLPEALAEKNKAVATGADIIFSDLKMFGEESLINEYNKYFFDVKDKFIKLDKSDFIKNVRSIIPKINFIPTFSVVMVKKELLLTCKYNPICKASLDFYLWAQLSNKKFYYVDKKLTNWRIHKNSYINTDKNNWFLNYLFYLNLYYQTIKDKNFIVRTFLLLNFMRRLLVYIKFNKSVFKLNIGNGLFIFEKFLEK